MSKLLNTNEAAAYLGNTARQTLAMWRITGRGPNFTKIGRRVFYTQEALDAYIKSQTFSSTSQYLLNS